MQNEVRGAPEYSLALRPGAQLAGSYTLRRLLSATSDYALTYLGADAASQRIIVKEFLPRRFVGRAADGCTVRPHTAPDEQQFARSLRRFAREADLLAQVTHPHLARVQQVVEANGTAYAILEWRDAQPLGDFVAEQGALSPRAATELILRLLDALAALHGEGIVHRHLAPECVLVDDAAAPALLALTAKRHVVSHGQDLTPGYAALEQYGAKDVGPWTDVYAVGALLCFLLTGTAPPSAVDRAAGQSLDSLGSVIGEVAPSLSRVLARALALLPDQRPHGARELQRQLESAVAASGAPRPAATRPGYQPLGSAPEAADDGRGAALRLAEGGIVVPNDDRGGWLGRLGRLVGRGGARPADDAHAALLETLLAQRAPLSAQAPAATPAATPTPLPPPMPAPTPDAARLASSAPLAPTPDVAAVVPPLASSAPPAPAIPAVAAALPVPAPLASTPLVPVPAEGPIASPALRPADFRLEEAETDPEVLRTSQRWRVGRRSLAAVAVMAVLLLTAGITYAARLARSPSVARPSNATASQRGNVAGSGNLRRVPADSHVVALRASDTPAAVLQGSATRVLGESSGRIESSHAPAGAAQRGNASAVSSDQRNGAGASDPTASHRAGQRATPRSDSASQIGPVPVPPIDVAVAVVAPQLHFLPPALLPDLRLRLASGKTFMEQGQYEAARRVLRQALDQVDSAAARYSSTEGLRALRREIEQADAESVQACTAENEIRRTRGAKLLQCQ